MYVHCDCQTLGPFVPAFMHLFYVLEFVKVFVMGFRIPNDDASFCGGSRAICK